MDDRMSTQWDTQRIARTVLIIAAVAIGVWMLRHFLPALAWAAVLAIATWPLRAALARRGMGETTIAVLPTRLLALILVLPRIGPGGGAAGGRAVITRWMHELRQDGIGTPDWVSRLPF